MFICLWDFIKYRPFPIYKTSPILENKALCLSVVTEHSIGREYFDSNTFTKQAFKKQNNLSRFSKQNISVAFSLSYWFMVLYILLYQNKNHVNMGTKPRTKVKNKRQNFKVWLQVSPSFIIKLRVTLKTSVVWQRLQYPWWLILFRFSGEPWISPYPNHTSHSFGSILQASLVYFKTKTQWQRVKVWQIDWCPLDENGEFNKKQ